MVRVPPVSHQAIIATCTASREGFGVAAGTPGRIALKGDAATYVTFSKLVGKRPETPGALRRCFGMC